MDGGPCTTLAIQLGMTVPVMERSALLAYKELAGRETDLEEHLLVSKALPIFLAPHYFCACSDLSLLCEAYDLSTHSEV